MTRKYIDFVVLLAYNNVHYSQAVRPQEESTHQMDIIFSRTFGPGYNVVTGQDECGCTVHLTFTPFEGLIKTIDEKGQVTEVFIGEIGRGIKLISSAPLPDGSKTPLDTWQLENAHIEEGELEEWLDTWLSRHHLRSFTDEELGTDEGQARHAAKVAEVKEEFIETIRSPWRSDVFEIIPGFNIALFSPSRR